MTRAPIPTRVAALAALIALGLVAAWFLRGGGMSPGSVPAGGGAGKQAQVSKGGSPGGPPGGVPVETMTAEQAPLAETVRAVGTLRSNESVMLRPEIAGRVLETLFTEGQLVAEGALLIRLDDAVAEAELAAAEAAAVLSRQNYARARELLTKGAGTARARDEALARMQMDKAQVELMRARLSKTRLIAPFAGIVGLRKVSVGDYVAPGQDIVNLESVDALKLDFRIPERH
ncbi:MAG: efflux RND transporter periplasmic adaptor subunit, partial [Alphaproteobacteria bacterium]|nr:efflux RND transporter periplasmic adaptor subunit [Alphaproteobacteria bacterium]